jgi:hypothetical protein
VGPDGQNGEGLGRIRVETAAMAEVREAIGVGEWGSQAHFGRRRCATAGRGDGNGERTAGHEVSSGGVRWRANS